MNIEINPNIELVQVLLYLSDSQEKTRQIISNTIYCNTIKDYFIKYIEHSAVLNTRELINKQNYNFIHIEPLRAILTLDEILSNEENELYKWAISVENFKNESNFKAFYESQKGYYEWILHNLKNYDIEKHINFIKNYFKEQQKNEFNLIICPIAGNYGFTLKTNNGESAYTVNCLPYYDENGNSVWYYDYFIKGIAHEYAHCFVNKTVESNKHLLQNCNEFFDSHKNIPEYYNVNYAVINEYWVRAFAIRFMEINKEQFPDFDIEKEYERQRESFLYIDRFVELLKVFETKNESFSDFYINNIKVLKEY